MTDSSPSVYPWFIAVRFRYHPHLVNWTKEIPGFYKEKQEDGSWITYVPEEMFGALLTEAKKCHVTVVAVGGKQGSVAMSQTPSIPDQL